MVETRTYEGGCHCGAVRYEVTMAPPTKAFTGNCSICSRMGWVLSFVPADAFKLLSGEDTLGDYQFGKKNVHHLFCTTCGIRSFTRGKNKSGEPVVVVNLRCVAGVDAAKLPVDAFDCASI